MNYYNEYDKKAAAWLRELIKEGLLPKGEVDERSIVEVQPSDIKGFTQCHLFAGVGGWAYALHLAGWPEDREVWTGSCPCQPFSVAGKGKGEKDERHLWPEFHRLIRECRPPVVFGEQVASKLGRAWLTGVRADLEALAYGVGAADLCAACVGAPHIRQRLWLVADTESQHYRAGESGTFRRGEFAYESAVGGVGNPNSAGLETCNGESIGEAEKPRQFTDTGATIWHLCRDGKHRRIPAEPALFPLADGLPGRVGLLRGAGNAIVPQVAAVFIKSYMETE